jgi:hypothetical protein
VKEGGRNMKIKKKLFPVECKWAFPLLLLDNEHALNKQEAHMDIVYSCMPYGPS